MLAVGTHLLISINLIKESSRPAEAKAADQFGRLIRRKLEGRPRRSMTTAGR